MKNIILLPTYNERENVALIIPEIFAALPDAYVLVIDDSSPDQTAAVVKDLMTRYSRLRLLSRPRKDGLGNAYKDALRRLIGEVDIEKIVTMDADGSHDPKYLPALLAAADAHDVVVGSRYVAGGGVDQWEWWRRALSKYGNAYARFLTGLKIKDVTAGFMCIRREALADVDLEKIGSAGYAFLIELKFYLLRRRGARGAEVPILFGQRRQGKTKFSLNIFFEGLRTPWRLWWKRIWPERDLSSSKTSWERCWESQDTSVNVIHFGRKIYNFFLFKFLKKHVNRQTDFLELGCGTASLGARLAGEVHSYTGFDIASNVLAKARQTIVRQNVKNASVYEEDILTLPAERHRQYGVVWSQGLIEHFAATEKLIDVHLQLCAPGGQVIISVPARYSYHHLWYLLTRFQPLRRLWPWTDCIFISKKYFQEKMKLVTHDFSRATVTYLKPRILGLLILKITK